MSGFDIMMYLIIEDLEQLKLKKLKNSKSKETIIETLNK